MPVSVRLAHGADLDTIVDLNHDVQRLHADLEPSFFKRDTDRSALREFFAAKLAMAEHRFWIACAGEGPSGYVWLEVQDRPETPLTWARRLIYVHHLSVRAAARRRGIAAALMRQVEIEALGAKAGTIALDAWAANEAAHAFFKDQGFTTFNLSYRKRTH